MKFGIGFLIRVTLVILAILAFLIAIWLVAIPSQITYYTQPGPDVNASLDLLIITVLYVSISAWISFVDREAKEWEKLLLLLSLMGGLLIALTLAFAASTAVWPEPSWLASDYPTLVNNLHSTTDYMLMLAAILFASVLGFAIIPRRESILEWMKNA
jgi:hypothetical protein